MRRYSKLICTSLILGASALALNACQNDFGTTLKNKLGLSDGEKGENGVRVFIDDGVRNSQGFTPTGDGLLSNYFGNGDWHLLRAQAPES